MDWAKPAQTGRVTRACEVERAARGRASAEEQELSWRWRAGRRTGAVEHTTLPAPDTPRSLAAHPTEPWIAVGIKQGGFGHPSSLVLVLEC